MSNERIDCRGGRGREKARNTFAGACNDPALAFISLTSLFLFCQTDDSILHAIFALTTLHSELINGPMALVDWNLLEKTLSDTLMRLPRAYFLR